MNPHLIQLQEDASFDFNTYLNQDFDNLDSQMIARLTDDMKASQANLAEIFDISNNGSSNNIELLKLQVKAATMVNDISFQSQIVSKGVKAIEILCKA